MRGDPVRQRVRSFMFWMHLIRIYGGPFRVVQQLKRERDEFVSQLRDAGL